MPPRQLCRPRGSTSTSPSASPDCPYCDFVVVAGSAAAGPGSRVVELLDAILRELELRADLLAGGAAHVPATPLASVYLGGGTPSLLSAAQVARLLGRIHERLGLAADAEVTIEANPGPDELGDLAGFRAAGVTRLSIGAQSFDDDELRRLGRRHRAADVRVAVDAARAAGLRSVSLDLLTDVPGQTLETWRATLERRAGPRARASLRVHAHARRPGCRRADRSRGRPPAGLGRRASLACPRPRGAVGGTGSGDGAAHRRAGSGGRAAPLRDRQPGPSRSREPAQPALLAPPPVPRPRSGGACLRRRPAAHLERGPP